MRASAGSRIVADKKKVHLVQRLHVRLPPGHRCHELRQQGHAMQDPECVRCSACVHSCPTGVLTFGQVRRDGALITLDALAASPVQMRERT